MANHPDCENYGFLGYLIEQIIDIEGAVYGLNQISPSPISVASEDFGAFSQSLADYRNYFRQALCSSFEQYLRYRISRLKKLSKKDLKVNFSFSTEGILQIEELTDANN